MITRLDSTAPHLAPADTWDDGFDDWGAIPTALEGKPCTYGKLLHRNADGSSETGIWHCTPGTWTCHVTSDEFCHFLSGECTYTHDDGDVIEVTPGTVAFFPANWRGTCVVRDTIRKVYMIR